MNDQHRDDHGRMKSQQGKNTPEKISYKCLENGFFPVHINVLAFVSTLYLVAGGVVNAKRLVAIKAAMAKFKTGLVFIVVIVKVD